MNAQECKKQAIELVNRAWTVNPPLRGELLAEAQVWATLAAVPDEIVVTQEAPPDTSWVETEKPWKSGGGAGQWNG